MGGGPDPNYDINIFGRKNRAGHHEWRSHSQTRERDGGGAIVEVLVCYVNDRDDELSLEFEVVAVAVKASSETVLASRDAGTGEGGIAGDESVEEASEGTRDSCGG